jgi:hypothetical protein
MTWFDVYYGYLDGCRRFNEESSTPEGGWEWHHILPQCLYGGSDPGVWLTFEQHAIASAYQTLAFDTNCLYGSHLPHLKDALRTLCREVRSRSTHSSPLQSERGKQNKGRKRVVPKTQAITEARKRNIEVARQHKKPEHCAAGGRAAGPRNGKTAMAQRWRCKVTGKVTNAAALSRWQMARGIDHKDLNNREKLA